MGVRSEIMDFVVRPHLGHFEPNADVLIDEGGRRVLVYMELAGIDPDSLQLSLDGHRLVISGRREDRRCLPLADFSQKEIGFGSFTKEVYLPAPVRYDELVAEFADGILAIALPMAEHHYVPTSRTELHIIVTRIRP